MEFYTVVKRIRKELGLSQEQLARELSISFSNINSFENVKYHPRQMAKEIFYNFCKSKSIDVDSYMKGEV